DRGVTEPGTNCDRFLSEFALALVEGVPPQEFLDWSVAQIGRILDVDRLTLFLFGAGAADGALAVQTSWAAEGVPPQEFLDWSVAQIGRILDVDRLTLFLFGAGAADGALAVQTSWAAEGVEPVPATLPFSA